MLNPKKLDFVSQAQPVFGNLGKIYDFYGLFSFVCVLETSLFQIKHDSLYSVVLHFLDNDFISFFFPARKVSIPPPQASGPLRLSAQHTLI